MSTNDTFKIAVLPGDGIGHEVMRPCLDILQLVARKVGGFSFSFEELPAGAINYRDTGVALPKATLKKAGEADAILLGAMGWPKVRYPDGTEIAPQIDLRGEFGLYAGVRPVRTLPNIAPVLADPRAQNIDFVIIRESTEGLFALRDQGTVIDDREARDTLVITREVCEPLFDFSFKLARSRQRNGGKGILTCVDKANVLTSMAFFRKIFDEVATSNTDVAVNHAYVDAMALFLVRRPWELDVLVTENMFGDILSDLAAGLVGGMGFAPSADIGDHHGVFQPCHGTAPDITGMGKANPTAMFLSAAMMMEWLGERHGLPHAVQGAALLRAAVDKAYTDGLKPFEIGGNAGTDAITKAVVEALAAQPDIEEVMSGR